MYGGYGEVKATRGKVHDYLGMTFDFSEPGKLKLDMIDYMKAMVDDFSINFKPTDLHLIQLIRIYLLWTKVQN